jgi:hypothetical protein
MRFLYLYNTNSTSPIIVTIFNCYDVCISDDNHILLLEEVHLGDNKTVSENAEAIINLLFVAAVVLRW